MWNRGRPADSGTASGGGPSRAGGRTGGKRGPRSESRQHSGLCESGTGTRGSVHRTRADLGCALSGTHWSGEGVLEGAWVEARFELLAKGSQKEELGRPAPDLSPGSVTRGKFSRALAGPPLPPGRRQGVCPQIFVDCRANLLCDGADYFGVLALDHHTREHFGARVPDQESTGT